MRDTQRKKTYEAEFAVRAISARGGNVELFGTTVTWPVERRFGHLEHIQVYLDHVTSSDWFKARWPKAAKYAVRVERRAGDRYAEYAMGTVYIHDPEYGKPGWAMREIVVLHELAHHVIAFEYAGRDVAGHGPEFRQVLVELVTEFIGPEAGWVLSTTYLDSGLYMPTAV